MMIIRFFVDVDIFFIIKWFKVSVFIKYVILFGIYLIFDFWGEFFLKCFNFSEKVEYFDLF